MRVRHLPPPIAPLRSLPAHQQPCAPNSKRNTMSRISKLILASLTLVVLCFSSASVANANPITFTFQGTGSGTLGNQSFTGSAFSVTLTTDTSTVMQSGGIYSTPISPTTFNIAGIGSGAFVTPVFVFNNTSVSVVGLERAPNPGGADILDLFSSSLASYNLQTNFGPITNSTPYSLNFGGILTSLGTLNISSATNVSFTAVTGTPPATVPEPTTMLLLGTGLAGIAARVRKQRHDGKREEA